MTCLTCFVTLNPRRVCACGEHSPTYISDHGVGPKAVWWEEPHGPRMTSHA
jgi:hypothetical protein